MKKIIIFLFTILILIGCEDIVRSNNSNDSSTIRYYDMIELIDSNTNFSYASNYFDISGDISKIDEGYRYYVFVDDPKIAMYDIEVMTIEKGVDYTNKMTANIGIFESEEYHMIPNQSDKKLGYVKGLSISGVTDKANVSLYVLVQWKNKNKNNTYREFLKLDLRYGER